MKVSVKKFIDDLPVRSKGMELEIRKPDGEMIGDCVVTMTGLTWCIGKTQPANGVKIDWKEFMVIMQNPETKKAALQAAKSVPGNGKMK